MPSVGRLTEAPETLDRARGHLYSLHELVGAADRGVREAVEELRAAGHEAQADRLSTDLVGRNVVSGRWTFQIVEDFDDSYWSAFRDTSAGSATSSSRASVTSSKPVTGSGTAHRAAPVTRHVLPRSTHEHPPSRFCWAQRHAR